MSNVEILRAQLEELGVDGIITSVGDQFLNEYVPPCCERLEWLTGFSGSAGSAIVLNDSAAFFTDSRYTVQAKMEVSPRKFSQHNSAEVAPEKWAAEIMGAGQKLGYDPRLHSVVEVERWEKLLHSKHITLVPLAENPIDRCWGDCPAEPASEIHEHPLELAGEPSESKCARLAEILAEKDMDATIFVASDSVCWLLNIRAQDVAYSPLARCYAVLERNADVTLYANSRRIRESLPSHINVRNPESLENDLRECGRQKLKIQLDKKLTPAWFAQTLEAAGATLTFGDELCQLPKAIKNEAELVGMRNAHLRDGIPVTKLLAWLADVAESGEISEMEVVEKLLQLRQELPEFSTPSFDTIAGSGEHGAIVHYRVTQKTDRNLQSGELFLLDSGGQYPDGTTDVTRTVAIGPPSEVQKRHFTLVLKGHIALADAIFPQGTSGTQLDILARQALWRERLDYGHGTGHGVGSYLNVHEGPQRISPRGCSVPLQPGMILSNEPGYYLEGEYGIRIENLVEVVECSEMESGQRRYAFSTLTCIPIDLELVAVKMLTDSELQWLNGYHKWVAESIGDKLSDKERAWLKHATRALKR